MNTPLIAVFLPTGHALALTHAELAEGLRRGVELGLGLGVAANTAPAQPPVAGHASSEWLDARELARRTGTDPRLWRSRARAGELPHKQVGRRILFPASVLTVDTRVPAPQAVTPKDVAAWKR